MGPKGNNVAAEGYSQLQEVGHAMFLVIFNFYNIQISIVKYLILLLKSHILQLISILPHLIFIYLPNRGIWGLYGNEVGVQCTRFGWYHENKITKNIYIFHRMPKIFLESQ